MPTYDYLCGKCGYREELVQSIKDALPKDVWCQECGGQSMNQVIGGVNLQFRGEGFYINDYAKEKRDDSRLH